MSLNRLFAAVDRISELRDKQKASGRPIVCCGYCNGETTVEPYVEEQHVLCECCGGQMIFRRPQGGGSSMLHPICAGPPQVT